LDYLHSFSPDQEIVLIGESRGAVDDLVREFCLQRQVTFGLYRFSIAQIATYLALPWLVENNLAPATALSEQALAARGSFQAAESGVLEYVAPVALLPGFARSLSKTIGELRAAGVLPQDLKKLGVASSDLSKLLDLFTEALHESRLCDRRLVF